MLILSVVLRVPPAMNQTALRPIPLGYPSWLRLVSAALVAVPLLAARIVWGEGPPEEQWHNVVPWTCLGLWLLLTYQVFLVELYYDERGVTYLAPHTGEVRLNWSEIVGLFRVRGLDGYVLEADDGRRIWFNDWRTGMDDFAAAIQQR